MAPAGRGAGHCHPVGALQRRKFILAAQLPRNSRRRRGAFCTAVVASLVKAAAATTRMPIGSPQEHYSAENTSALQPRTLWPLMAKQLGSMHTMHKVSLGAYPLARCLDGSPGTFYIAPAKKKTNAQKWSIHFPSSGVCSLDAPRGQSGDCLLVEHCFDRSRGPRGSSTSYPMMTPLVESEQMAIPLTRDWNRVVAVSCDGGMFSGRAQDPVTVDGTALYFRGGYIVDAIIDTLLRRFNLDQATDVVVSGTGAGGTAVSLHADQWRTALPEATFLAVLSDTGMSGSAMTSATKEEENPVAALHRANFHSMNASGSVHQECIAERRAAGAEESDCFFADFATRYARTPVFVKQSASDIGEPLCASKTALNNTTDFKDKYASQLHAHLQRAAQERHQHGFWIDNCMHEEGKWIGSRINGTSATEALNSWFSSRQKAYYANESFNQTAMWEQTKPCNKAVSEEPEGTVLVRVQVHGSEALIPPSNSAGALSPSFWLCATAAIARALLTL